MKKVFLNTEVAEVDGHIALVKTDDKEYHLRSDKNSEGNVSNGRAEKITIQTI